MNESVCDKCHKSEVKRCDQLEDIICRLLAAIHASFLKEEMPDYLEMEMINANCLVFYEKYEHLNLEEELYND